MKKVEDKINVLFLENMLVNKLMVQALELIHCTKKIVAIKKLTQVYDILDLNKEIIQRYKKKEEFYWDKAAIQDLNHITKELIVFHREDFNPIFKIYHFNENVSNFVSALYANDEIK
jgi:predicted nucleotidyltransferase component of viral defense system